MKNLVLIGMAGAGKSTIGVLLAKATGMAYIDTDLLVQEKEKKLLQAIISEKGIEGFLKTEEQVILCLDVKNSVIATGGSVIYSIDAMKKLKEHGVVVYLKVSYGEIEKRIRNITSRGIVMRKEQTLYDVYTERVPLYEKYADKIIDCSGMDIEEIVQKLTNVIEAIK